MPILLTLLIVFTTAKALAEVFERLMMPGIIGEVVAGTLIGPAVLGWVAPNDRLKMLSDLGVMFLLFGVGLEVKASELLKVGAKATVVATAGVIVPFFAGWGILRAWGAPQVEAIFVGASMVATSVGITASVLSTKKLLHEMASQIILAAAVIDDVLGLIVLAAVSSVARGHVNLWEIALTAVLATAFTVVMGLWGTKAATRSMAILAVVILVAAIVTKLIGCGLGAASLGWRNVLKVGLGMVPRGEVGMVVAQIGLGMAAISSEVYSVVVFMAVATTLVTPLLLKIAFRPPALEAAPV